MVNELKVYCPNRFTGCDHINQRQHMTVHLRSCSFMLIPCTRAECKEMVPKRDLAEHLQNQCEWRTVKCDACIEQVLVKDLEAHKERCPAKLVSCPHCKKTGPLGGFDTHLAECPQLPCECPHAARGCPWSGLQPELSAHIKVCAYEAIKGFFAIYDQQSKQLQEMAESKRALEEENTNLKHKVSDLEQDVERIGEAMSGVADFLDGYFGTIQGPLRVPSSSNNTAGDDAEMAAPYDILIREHERTKHMVDLLIEEEVMKKEQIYKLCAENFELIEQMDSIRRMVIRLADMVGSLNIKTHGGGPNGSSGTPGSSGGGPGGARQRKDTGRLLDSLLTATASASAMAAASAPSPPPGGVVVPPGSASTGPFLEINQRLERLHSRLRDDILRQDTKL
ncbi:uncharacterized protein VTP21DRAFT_6241 [Calcarisporiella thermophila]|uniref:uncharacterized protein n=1 Tax=Calcarisporiella thermophila TaxID=911321 RepID=UPI003743842F